MSEFKSTKRNITSEADVNFREVYYYSKSAGDGKIHRFLNFFLCRRRRHADLDNVKRKKKDTANPKFYLNPLRRSDVIFQSCYE